MFWFLVYCQPDVRLVGTAWGWGHARVGSGVGLGLPSGWSKRHWAGVTHEWFNGSMKAKMI